MLWRYDSMASAFNMKTYIRNVAKSAGYVTIESAKELNPIISEFASTNVDSVKNIIAAARDYKKISREGKQSIADSEYSKIAKETFGNIISDLKTGNFYNKARQSKYEGTAFGIDMDDWDINLDDINIDDDGLTMSGMDDIGEKIVKGTGKATIESADYIVKSHRATAKGIMAQNELLFASLNNTLGSINSTVISVGKSVLKPSLTHFENSTKFYEMNTKQMAEQTGYLKQIYDMLNDRYNPKKTTKSLSKNRYAAVMGSGSFDIAEYNEIIKENFKSMTSLITSFASMMSMGGNGPGMARLMLSSPISSVMKMGVTGFGQKTLGKDFERLNKSLSGLFGSTILKMNRNANKDIFSLSGLIGNLLGITPSSKRNIDTSKYEKGRVDWSGKDAKALREVIPTQLALILSSITGKEPKVFNYESGKWVNYSSTQKSLISDVKNITKFNTSDIQDQFNKYFAEDNKSLGKNSKAFHSFQQDMNNFFHYLTMHNDRIPLSQAEWRDLEKRLQATGMFGDASNPNGMMLKSNFNRIKSYYARNVINKKGHLNTTTNGALINARNEVGRFYETQESDPASAYGMLFNKSGLGEKATKNNMFTFAIDDKGNNMFFYLQSFYKNLERIADNTEGGYGGRGGRPGRNRKSYNIPTNQSSKSFSTASIATNADRFVDADDANAGDYVYVEKEKKEKSEEVKDRITKFLKKHTKNLGKGGEVIASLLDFPIRGLRSAMDYADNTMYNMVYGKDSDKNNPGILAKIMQGFDDTFKTIKLSISKFFKDTFSPIVTAFADRMSNVFGFNDFKSMKNQAFNGIKNSKFVTGVKSNLKSAGKWVKGSIGGTLSELDNYFTGGKISSGMRGLFGKVSGVGKRVRPNVSRVIGSVFNQGKYNDQAADGGMITKSGMVSVSEGEMIIPAEHNPYYNGYVNKSVQMAKEKSVASRWKALSRDSSNYWGEYAKGGTVKDPAKNKSIIRMMKRGARFARERKTRAANKMKGMSDDASDAAGHIYRDTMDDLRDTVAYQKAFGMFDQAASIIKNGAIAVTSKLFGKTTDKDGNPLSDSEIEKNTSSSMRTIWGELKKNAPSLAAGGIIGGGASLVTGMVGGPLVGAAVGSAIGLATQSDAFRKKLFGTGYKDGDYKGGIFGPKLSKIINEKGAKLAKFGVTGAAGGMLGVIPGGPIAGIIAGSALSFATENDRLKNYLFGEEGLLGKGTDEKIKKAMPKMGIGAASLAFTGPFGLIGNMMVGAGLGYVSESEKFKETIFGTLDSNGQRQGGVLGVIRKRVIDPMADYFKGGAKKFEDYLVEWVFKPIRNVIRPLTDMAGHGLNKIGEFIKGQFKDKITTPLAKKFDYILKPVSGFFGRIGKTVIGAARNIGTLPGRALNRVGKELDRKAIRGGYSSLSAEERAVQGESDWYLRNNNYRTKKYDKQAASMGYDDLQSARDALEMYRGNVTNARVDSKQIRQNVMNRILADSKYGTTLKEDKLLRKELNASIDTGNLNLKGINERVNQLISSGKINKDQGSELKKYLRDQNRNIKDVSKKADSKRVLNNAEKAASRLGVSLDDYMKDKSVRSLILNDIYDKKSSVGSTEPKTAKATVAEKATGIDLVIHPITEVKDVITKTKDVLSSKLDSILAMVGKVAGVDVKLIPDGDSDTSTASKNSKHVRRAIQAATVKGNKKQAEKEKREDDADSTKTEFTDDGGVIKFVKDAGGNWLPNLRDALTNRTIKTKKAEMKLNEKSVNAIMGVATTFSGLAGLLFSKKKKKKKDDDKPNLFDSIFGDMGGKGGFLKSMLPIIGSIAAAMGLGNIAHTLMPDDYKIDPDKKGNIFTNTVRGAGEIENLVFGHKTSTYKDGDFERKTIPERLISQGLVKNSLIKGQTGSKVLRKIPIVGKGANFVLSSAGKARNWAVDRVASSGVIEKAMSTKAAQKGIAVASKGASTVLNNASKVGSWATDKVATNKFVQKGISSIGNSKMAKMATEGGKKVLDSGMMSKIISLAQTAISKALSFMGVKGGEAIAKEGAEQLGKAAAEAGADKVTKSFAKSAALPIQIAFVAAAVENGFEDAKSILGIIDTPSIPERILAAAINGINEAVPGIGGVVPTEYIFNILYSLIRVTGFFDTAAFEAKRQEAKAVVEDYNNTNGTTYNVREYIKNVLGEHTTQEKIGRGLVKGVKAVGKGAKFVGSSIINAPKNYVKMHINAGKAIYGAGKKVGSAALNGAKIAISEKNKFVAKTATTVFGAVKTASSVIEDNLTPTKKFDIKEFIKQTWEYTDTTKHKDTKGIYNLIGSYYVKGGSVGDMMNGVTATLVGGVMRFIINTIRPFMTIKDTVMNLKDKIFNFGSNAVNTVKDKVSTGWNNVKTFFGFGNNAQETGTGSGFHVSQKDPNYAGNKFGRRTIGENGCGPAVAATILNRYGRNASINDTANYANTNGYVAGSSGVGTRASYFGDILGSNGISSAYTKNQKDIKSAIKSGRPTVLLGQDSKNTSKSNSPFGPNNHYIVAQGMDRRGNVVVDDPELGGTALYKNNILSNVKLGVITGGDTGLNSDYVGKHVKQFESGADGSLKISKGTGDYGGVSFGSYQFPSYKSEKTTKGNLPVFWNRYYASQFPGVVPGDNASFKSAWVSAVNKDPSGFFKNEHEFMANKYYSVATNILANNGVGNPSDYDRAAQEAIWSTAVQYGPETAAKLFLNSGVKSNMSPKDYITKLYDYKKNSVGSYFKSSSKAVQNGIASRFEREKNILLGLTGQKTIDPGTTNGATSIGGTNSSSASNTESSSLDFASLGIGGTIDKILGNAIGKFFNNTDSGNALKSIFGISSDAGTDSNNSNNGSNNSTFTPDTNFTNSGNTEKENKIVSSMSSLFGKLGYSQKNRFNFTNNGSSDCSATVQHVLKSSIGVDPGGDTGAQLSGGKGKIVDVGNGSGPNESNLKPGDLLFYRRASSSKPMGVGHVEMYMGNGQRAGHGGGKNSPFGLDTSGHGKGPFVTPVANDAGNYIEAKRYTASGSGIQLIDFTKSNPKQAARESTQRVIGSLDSGLRQYGGASGTDSYAKLIETAIEYMKIIANNTSYNANIKTIVDILGSMMNLIGGNMSTANASSDEARQQMDQDTKSIMAKLKALASTV